MDSKQQIELLHREALNAVRRTSIKDEVTRLESAISGGKMIRGRLVMAIGAANNLATAKTAALGAAIELLHTGSLLHDDIVDGGTERRNNTALWVSDGVKSAVVVGDLLLSIAMDVLLRNGPEQIPVMVSTLSAMCDAQAEQEFHSGDAQSSWDDCLSIARRKTGALFGLAAACGAGTNAELAAALEAAGTDLGTAYQLADDLLDTAPHSHNSGKSLGTDAAAGKLTAATFDDHPDINARLEIEKLLQAAADKLSPWPTIYDTWNSYTDNVISPIIEHFINHSD